MGIERHQAEDLVAKLTEKVPSSIRHKIGELVVFGIKSYKVKVFVAPPAALEVSMIWNEVLKGGDQSVKFNGTDQYVTVQREAAEAKRYASGGKARAFLEAKIKSMGQTAEVKCTWHPDWQLTVSSNGSALLGTIGPDSSIAWCPKGLWSAFGWTVETAQKELAAFRQA